MFLMPIQLKSPARLIAILLTIALWSAALYVAHLSGRAISAAGTTIESQDLQALSGMLGFPAVAMYVALLVAEQSGGIVVRLAKFGTTFAAVFALYVGASFALRLASSP